MSLLNMDQYSELQRRSLQRIKEKMAAAALRAETQYKRSRQHERKPFQGVVSVHLPTPNQPLALNAQTDVFQAWAYDLSQGGIAFVTPEVIPQGAVVIGLKLPDGFIHWMPGRIVRSRPIPEEEFFDYGVAFQRPKT